MKSLCLKIASMSTAIAMLPTKAFAYGEIDLINQRIGEFVSEINWILAMFMTGGLATSVAILIVHFVRLASAYGHPIIRNKVLKDILITGICTAFLGVVNTLYYLIVFTFL